MTTSIEMKSALRLAVRNTMRLSVHPTVRETAIVLSSGCTSRDDDCELKSVFDGVSGRNRQVDEVRELVVRGYGKDVLQACGVDPCVLFALVSTMGFQAELHGWGPNKTNMDRVYVYVGIPKRDPREFVALDFEPEVRYESGYTVSAKVVDE